MSVFPLPGADSRELALLFGKLQKLALAGRFDGTAVSLHSPDGTEQTEYAGTYARDRAAALRASLRQSCTLGLYEARALMDQPRPNQRRRAPDGP
jgi:hypothetical protein